MAAAIPFFQVAGAVMSAIGALQQGQAAKAAGDYNRQINEQNAAIARQDALARSQQADREAYLRLGAIRAQQGHSGGASDAGSILDVLGDVAAQSELEKQHILYRGELSARGYQNTATLDSFSGETAQRTSYLRAGSELLSGGVRAYTSYKSLNRN